ncbi:ectonucleoside triphosphate diphosphohydrolase 3-like [Dreissena polymorpha]|uniref:Uncharacterized protein n=1 Tax=Dreissena polymorpha TaxID=45954 RepID=A0A9D4KAU8_DREPO|nr:ectonucleoside triphosphate diphosphohydrolase 3-like [Dreissena polymorpha]XP_052277502.1 ectonucleoside triphosphate diphosphohydrolase 3-like [Dreissena polymorpha]KAH3836390.1 hypothetical protein DPMN_109760 [Dreissena polymorpha]
MFALMWILLGTLWCVACLPVSPNREYGILLDAGSSSTKVRVYGWHYAPMQMQVPVFVEVYSATISPGIDALMTVRSGMFDDFVKILEGLKGHIPSDRWSETSIYLMATAGLRLLDEEVTSKIMQTIHKLLGNRELNPFRYQPENAHILSGEEEGLFAWLTVNYLKGYFSADDTFSQKSFGLIELGGGSAQIAFIPDDPIYAGKMPANIAGQEYGVYCHSYLSFGAGSMVRRVVDFLIRENPNANVINNPCMLKGDSTNHTIGHVTIGIVGEGNASLCESVLRHFLSPAADEMCSPKPCSIGQVYQPAIRNNKFFSFGLIYLLAKGFNAIKKDGRLNLVHFQEKARHLCGQSLNHVVDTLRVSPKFASRNCQDGLYIPLFMAALGFEPSTQNVYVADSIKQTSIAWSLGAMLYEEERNRYSDLVQRNGEP